MRYYPNIVNKHLLIENEVPDVNCILTNNLDSAKYQVNIGIITSSNDYKIIKIIRL